MGGSGIDGTDGGFYGEAGAGRSAGGGHERDPPAGQLVERGRRGDDARGARAREGRRHRGAALPVERLERLVEQQKFRATDERARDGHASPLAAREVGRGAPGERRRSDRLEGLADARRAFAAGNPERDEREFHVLEGGPPHQIGPLMEEDGAPGRRDVDAPGRRDDEARERAQQRALARAVRAVDPDGAAGLHLEMRHHEGHALAVADDEVEGEDHRRLSRATRGATTAAPHARNTRISPGAIARANSPREVSSVTRAGSVRV